MPAMAAAPTVAVAVSPFDVSDELLHHQEGHDAAQDPETDGHRVLVFGACKEGRGSTQELGGGEGSLFLMIHLPRPRQTERKVPRPPLQQRGAKSPLFRPQDIALAPTLVGVAVAGGLGVGMAVAAAFFSVRSVGLCVGEGREKHQLWDLTRTLSPSQ